MSSSAKGSSVSTAPVILICSTDEAGAFSVDEILEVVEAVKKEKVAEIIYLSLGFTSEDDGGIEFLAPYIKAIKKHFRILVAVEALPPKRNSWIDDTYAMGADSVLYNLEIFDKGLFEIICPGRSELIGRKRYLDALKYAASIFPNGTVASHLIVGLGAAGLDHKRRRFPDTDGCRADPADIQADSG